MALTEHIMMIPKGKTQNSTKLWIERKIADKSEVGNAHVAGGNHRGLIIQKDVARDEENEISSAQISLQFRVYLVDASDGSHTTEARTLGFWFKSGTENSTCPRIAQDFFRELVTPDDFPRDYVGFITRLMKLMQHGYPALVRIEILLEMLVPTDLPERPSSDDESLNGKHVELSEEKLLEIIESAYPNPITVSELSSQYEWREEEVEKLLVQLQDKSLVKSMEHGAFTRITEDDTHVQVVQNMAQIVRTSQPTVAIITSSYAEKLAVDAMMAHKETYVRYTTVGLNIPGSRPRFGESNVYTLGDICGHRVVCTKLPAVGHTREAMTAAGNTTTRLLGTFQHVEHVILVGVAGAVPHYTDYSRHARLGDVVFSCPLNNYKHCYVYCESATEVAKGKFEFETKSYAAKDPILQNIAAKIYSQSTTAHQSFIKHLDRGQRLLKDCEHDFRRPSPDTDKLYMAINERDLIEVTHPVPPAGFESYAPNLPRFHLGSIASGRDIARHNTLRHVFSERFDVLAFDPEFDAVVESIIGNCTESFLIIRGMADYKDGTRRTEWQNYSSLAAAAAMATLLEVLDPLIT